MDAFLRQSIDIEAFTRHRATLDRAMTASERSKLSKIRNRLIAKPQLPFVGVDGEGAGIDEKGRQNYLLLRAGDRELFEHNKRLTTETCLAFIASLPAHNIYVGFAFNYDATMILRDIPPDRSKLLFETDTERELNGRKSPYVYYKNFGIDYRPSQYLRVCRLENNKRVVGSTRTIYETFGFFQASFLKTLRTFGVGTDYLEMIEKNKSERSTFETMTREVREYNKIECKLLAELMDKFRTLCHDGGIKPRTWNGSGKLASALHSVHKTVMSKNLELPDGLMNVAKMAYYGGRFEVTRTGLVEGPIYEYDINSAYPAAMQNLPCLEHGKWERGFDLDAEFSICRVTFKHGRDGNVLGLPIRTKTGVLTWPTQGIGVYWSAELRAAMQLGMTYHVTKNDNKHIGWTYRKNCSCMPFQWVNELFNYRLSIGKAERGIPIKLAINSLYGKLAQRIGSGQWTNHLWAGLITAQTRSWLMDAAHTRPDAVIMFATDGVYSTEPLPGLSLGTGLGQWELSGPHPRMFIVQPGFYWGTSKPKRRGMPQKFFEPLTPAFESKWREFIEIATAAWTPDSQWRYTYPYVSVPMQRFIGMRLANAWGKHDRAGVWESVERDISFDWTNKRRLQDYTIEGASIRHYPIISGRVETQYYNWNRNTETIAQQLAMDTEANPDYMDFSRPFKD